MAAQLAQPPAIATTYKLREAEGVLDRYFYRKLGFQLAKFFAKLGTTPVEVTLLGGVFGIVAGHLYFYRSVALNLSGMLLQVTANIFDNADGQLARLTNQQSRTGRILDPVVDHIIWLSIYVHLTFRLQFEGFSSAIWILAIAAGISHGLQAGAADYCRNAYLYFVKGRFEFDSVSSLQQEYRRYTWRADAWRKFLLRLYLNAMHEQELLLPGIKQLHKTVVRDFAGVVPPVFRTSYAAFVLPTFKWWSLLMTNVRMLVLFILFLVGQPAWFFWLEISLGNLLLLYLIVRQQKIALSLLERFAAQKGRA